MRETRTLAVPIFCLLLAALPRVLDAQPSPETARLDAIFRAWNSQDTPGCAVGVSRNGAPVVARAYGMANLEHGIPNTPGTIYEAGSVSKQFTAAAIILLALDGRLSLDDDVRSHVPEVPDHGAAITIRHLLTHTSGLRDWGSVAALSGWGRGVRTHNHDHVLDILSRQSALNHPPGAAYSYTNSGYNLLAVIVERVSGVTFAEFSRRRIFEPLGLADTQWRDDYRRLVPGRATAYSPVESGFEINQPIEHVHGNGGLLTTVGDLLAWTESLDAASLAGEEFVRLMHETAVLDSGRPIDYAAGLRVDAYRGTPRVSHTGSTAGYRAFLGRYPEHRLAVAMLCNVSAVSTAGTGSRIADIFLDGRVADAGDDRESLALPAGQLRAKTGLYRHLETGEPMRLVMEEDRLRMEGGPALRPLSEDAFETVEGGRRFLFEAAADGTAPRIREILGPWDDRDAPWPAGTWEPVEEFDPSVADLAAYAGDYHSPDAETTFVVAVEDGGLVMYRRPGARLALEPVYGDGFQGSLGFVRFHRDAAGRVREFGLREPRVHDIRFRRELR